MPQQFTICGSGHRPPKLGGYSPEAHSRLRLVARHALSHIKPTTVISGMALGWDIALCEESLSLGLRTIAAVPCPSQPSKWPPSSQALYQSLLARCDLVHIVSPVYSTACMQLRNEWMVNRSTLVLACWDGSPGGTANCLRYATKVQVPITNCYKHWQSLCRSGAGAS